MGMKGADRHINRLKRLAGPTLERNVGRALFAGGERIQTAAQIGITTGAISGAGHVVSAPGDFPNQDTGVLGNNIETVQKAPLLVEVSSNAPYSAPLEFGTSQMEARPFMRPARDAERAAVVKLLDDAVKRTSRGR